MPKFGTDNFEENIPVEAFQFLPCHKKFRLQAEDEISIESIISALLSNVEPTEAEFKKCRWDISANDYHNEKQSLLFEDKLLISRLTNSKCQLSSKNKIFMPPDLEQVGKFSLNIEESFDGYVVFARSEMRKANNNMMCGYQVKGKYDNKFTLICEKRVEYDYFDGVKVAKILEARNNEDTELIMLREIRINEDAQQFRAVINIKDREETFVMDGGVMLLMRYMIVNKLLRWDRDYYTINLEGKVLRCKMEFIKERKKLRVLHKLYSNIILVKNTQYFNDCAEVSETYFKTCGGIILHFWHGYNYVLHAVSPLKPPIEPIQPRLELMWRLNPISFKVKNEFKLNYKNATKYLESHPQVSDFLFDYIMNLLKYQPTGVVEFTLKYFRSLRRKY